MDLSAFILLPSSFPLAALVPAEGPVAWSFKIASHRQSSNVLYWARQPRPYPPPSSALRLSISETLILQLYLSILQ